MSTLRRIPLTLAATGLVVGLLVPTSASASPPGSPDAALTDADCTALVGQTVDASDIDLPTGGATVTSAVLTPASGALPEYCEIRGAIAPVDPAAPDIEFGIDLPTAWNGSAWQLGGGGANGSIPNLTAPAGGTNQVYPGDASPLGLGYATFGSDSGHQGYGIEWIANHEALMNYAYEQLDKTHDTAVALIETVTGQGPDRMYFSGNSQGGREALMVAARWPDDYDGISASVGLAYFGSLIVNVPYLGAKQLEPGTWIPPRKGAAIGDFVEGLCDQRDGVTDGVINDYLGCNTLVDPVSTPDAFRDLLCEGGSDTGDTCLSSAQLPVLDAMYGPLEYDYPLAFGERLYPGWGTGLEGGGFVLSNREPVITDLAYGQGPGTATTKAHFCYPLGYTDCDPEDPPFSVLSFDIDAWQPIIQELSEQMDVPDTIDGWLADGGKLIMTTHASDSVSNPKAQMMLYNRWVEHHGRDAVDDSVRYFVVPNSGHGASGGADADDIPVPVSIRSQSMLIDWVENGVVPPTQTDAAAMRGGTLVASKPVCAFPGYPKHVDGPTTEAASYVCTDARADLADQIADTQIPASVTSKLTRQLDDVAQNLDDTARACADVRSFVGALAKGTTKGDIPVADASAMLTTVGAVKWGIGCLTAERTDAGLQQLFALIRTLDALDVHQGADAPLRNTIRSAAQGLAAGDRSCHDVNAIDAKITGISDRGGRSALTADEAEELHAGVQAIRAALRCAD